jgi:diazepam-binding inhibitor (GABA receptor modulating acyl-CoA-binding protein)
MQNSLEFINATTIVKNLAHEPTRTEKGKLYGLYKQATIGNINIEKPSILNLFANEKWNYWNNYKNIEKDEAEIQYIMAVNDLIQKYGIHD